MTFFDQGKVGPCHIGPQFPCLHMRNDTRCMSSFIQQILTEYLLCASQCSGHWGTVMNRIDKVPAPRDLAF